jgi:GT2 family glycosyltransferase/2-polyprenyl-3-methyl-5-hydroxy-6-metoxy-1,4-benzoquinol methylase
MSTSRKNKDPKNIYNEEYFQKYCGGIPYNRDEAHWGRFFGNVADKIIQIINPLSVMDLGCAKGFLVEALRDRGVEAYGIDISGYAISQVRDDIKQFCRVGSVVDPIDKEYDLITCIEVLEHVPEEVAKIAIQNMVKRTHNILFSSPPNDFDEPTHINVHPVIYWLELFSEYGFYPDLAVDADFVAAWALLLRKKALVQGEALLRYFARSIDTKIALAEKYQQIEKLHATVQAQQMEMDRIHTRLGWRLLRKLDRFKDTFFSTHTKRRRLYDSTLSYTRVFIKEGWRSLVNEYRLKSYEKGHSNDPAYNLWIAQREPDRFQLSAMRSECLAWPYRPKVSIIVPVYNPDKNDLIECIKSVLIQIYDNWDLCLVDGGSNKGHVKKIIKKFARQDSRIKYVLLSKNKGIAGNSNEALKLATGEFVGLLDHDDMLAPFALYEVVKLLNQDCTADFIYSDEDKVPENGVNRFQPFFKPGWSPDTFLSYNYLCHFTVVRRTLIEQIGGFREGYDGAQDYDLMLRAIQKTDKIRHISKILYHWRATSGSVASQLMAKPYAPDAAKRAIGEYLKARGYEAEILDGLFPTSYRVKYKLRSFPDVSIIIPTRDLVYLLSRCVFSILERTEYKNYEILIMDNQSQEKETYDFFKRIQENEKVRVIPYDRPFNYAAINNKAVRHAKYEYLLFLNNDTEVISGEWLSAMLEFAQRDDVGAVGAKLYYPDDTIQHGGVIIGLGGLGIADHSHRHMPGSSPGDMGRLKVIQNLSAVTAACMMVRKKVFEEVKEFDERLSHDFNDVDLCLKIREKGYLIVFTPYAELYHYEMKSRGSEARHKRYARALKDAEFIRNKWKHIYEEGDPYYNPNLRLDREDFSIRL